MFTNRRAVLHIDDDPALCRFVAEVLGPEGYEVESLTNPLDAMDALVEGQYQLVLLDIDMPNKTGMHLLDEIKAHDAGVQVIMLTGLVGLPTVLETHRLGAEACLFKPVTDTAVLVESVADAFRRMDRWWVSLRDLTQRRKTYESPHGGVEVTPLPEEPSDEMSEPLSEPLREQPSAPPSANPQVPPGALPTPIKATPTVGQVTELAGASVAEAT